jgi:hypothetical protein
MKFAFMKKLFAHPVLLSLLSLSVCAAGAGVGYATWAYTSVNVDPSANAYKNGTATAGAFNFSYDVAPTYPVEPETTKSGNTGGYYDADGNEITETYTFGIRTTKVKKKTYYYIETVYLPSSYTQSDLPNFIFPTYVTYSSQDGGYVPSTSGYAVSGTYDWTSNAHDNADALNIILPYSYTKIGTYSLAGFYGMTTVTITQVGNTAKSSALTIGANAFQDDYALTYVNLSSNVTSIGKNAFVCGTDYTPAPTVYITFDGTSAAWANVTLASSWNGGRSIVVRTTESDGSYVYHTYGA